MKVIPLNWTEAELRKAKHFLFGVLTLYEGFFDAADRKTVPENKASLSKKEEPKME